MLKHSKNYDKVASYFEKGLWDENRVRQAVGRWITKDEYEEITNNRYLSLTEEK